MRPLKVLVNAATLVVGGGVQVGASLVEYASRIRPEEGLDFHFLVSQAVFANLPENVRSDSRIRLIRPTPARIMRGRGSRAAIRMAEREFGADIVYSVGAPSYVRFEAPEIARLTWPWATHASSLAWSVLPLHRRLLRRIEILYKLRCMRHTAFFETQTEVAARGISRALSVSDDRVRVIPNAVSQLFLTAAESNQLAPTARGETFRLLTIAAPYPHKNLPIIPSVARILRDRGRSPPVRFVVTLPPGSRRTEDFMKLVKKMNVESLIENVGTVRLQDCPALYENTDAVFAPTLLETFSVTYLEAMQMGKPIIAADTDFARDICGPAAEYYAPLCAERAAEAIEKLMTSPDLRHRMAAEGRRRLGSFPNSTQRYSMAIDFIRDAAARTL